MKKKRVETNGETRGIVLFVSSVFSLQFENVLIYHLYCDQVTLFKAKCLQCFSSSVVHLTHFSCRENHSQMTASSLL